MGTIYIVTSGEYSDYRICAVFDNRELAEKFIFQFTGCQIEEFRLNPYKQELTKGYKPYFVRMTYEGDTKQVRVADSEYGFTDDTFEECNFDFYGNIYVHCFAKDDIHAIKITNEKRIQMIATDKWQKKAGETTMSGENTGET